MDGKKVPEILQHAGLARSISGWFLGLAFQSPAVYRPKPKTAEKLFREFVVVKVMTRVTDDIQKSKTANPLVVHVGRLKAYLGAEPKSWL